MPKENTYRVDGDIVYIDISIPSRPNTEAMIDRDQLKHVLDGGTRWRVVAKGPNARPMVVRNIKIDIGTGRLKATVISLSHHLTGVNRNESVFFLNGNSLDLRMENLHVGKWDSEMAKRLKDNRQ